MIQKFSKQAALYARYRPDYPAPMYDFIFKHLLSQKNAWDCATGTGQVAKYLAGHFEKVFATDISREQLQHAPAIENIIYRKAAAEDSKLPPDFFDLVVVAQAIHWFNMDKFYKEVRRVGKEGALLAVVGYGMIRINSEIDPIVDELYEEAFGMYFNENRKFLDEKYRTIPFPFEEIPAPTFKQKLNWTLDDLNGYFNSWSAIQKIKSEEKYNPVNETINKIKKAVASEKIQVCFPVFMRLGKI